MKFHFYDSFIPSVKKVIDRARRTGRGAAGSGYSIIIEGREAFFVPAHGIPALIVGGKAAFRMEELRPGDEVTFHDVDTGLYHEGTAGEILDTRIEIWEGGIGSSWSKEKIALDSMKKATRE